MGKRKPIEIKAPFNRIARHYHYAHIAKPFVWKWICPLVEHNEVRFGLLWIDGTLYTVNEGLEWNCDTKQLDPDLPEITMRLGKHGHRSGAWRSLITRTTESVDVPENVDVPELWAERFFRTVRDAFATAPRQTTTVEN
jgi:hypothetical protein